MKQVTIDEDQAITLIYLLVRFSDFEISEAEDLPELKDTADKLACELQDARDASNDQK